MVAWEHAQQHTESHTAMYFALAFATEAISNTISAICTITLLLDINIAVLMYMCIAAGC